MSYPVFKPDESVCSHCGNELEDAFVTVRDNFLIVKYFDYEDGQDNMFCDHLCLANSLSAETVYVEEGAGEC